MIEKIRICHYWPDSPVHSQKFLQTTINYCCQIIGIPNACAAAVAQREGVRNLLFGIRGDEADSSPLKRFGMTRLTKDTRQTEKLVSTHFFFGGVVRIYVIIQDLNELRHNLVAL